MKVTLEAVNSANIRVNNSVDADKVYNVVANLNVQGERISNVSDGIVKLGEEQKATFNKWSSDNLNIQFQTGDVMEMCTIINAINDFITDCENAVTNNEFNI